jgi:hypothetical protein
MCDAVDQLESPGGRGRVIEAEQRDHAVDVDQKQGTIIWIQD